MRQTILIILFLYVTSCVFSQEYSVLDFGAKGDGITFDTEPIRAALAAAANTNGGRVVFDAGYKFLTAPFNITSNVIVDIRGTIIGSPNSSDYYGIAQDPWFLDWSPTQSHPLILSYMARNITITGGGLINGQAENWNCSGCVGPFTLKLMYTNDSVVDNITLFNCPRWTLVLGYATNIHINHVNITNPVGYLPSTGDGINNDGYDIVCSVNVTLENSYYKGGDDGVMVKSGRNGPALLYGRPSEHIYVRNMTLETSGGIGAGAEITAGVRNVTFEDIHLIGALRGINVQSQRGMGGFIEDLVFRNIRMVNVNRSVTISQFFVTSSDTSNTPRFNNFLLENITIDETNLQSNWFTWNYGFYGAEESPISNVTIRNVNVTNSTLWYSSCSDVLGTCSNVFPSCPCEEWMPTTTTLLPTTTLPTCPDNWTYFNQTNSYYAFISDNKTFADASYYCSYCGGQLTSIHSSGEETFLDNLTRQSLNATQQAKFPWFWIGFHTTSNQTWAWTDNSIANYTHWSSGAPGWTNLPCAYFIFTSGNNTIRWDNYYPCTESYPFVCKMKSC